MNLRTLLRLALLAPACIGTYIFAADPSSAGTGSVTGWVSNSATGDLLRGAMVQVSQLGRSVLSDDTGFFVFHGLPAGEYEIVVTYAGLDAARERVAV